MVSSIPTLSTSDAGEIREQLVERLLRPASRLPQSVSRLSCVRDSSSRPDLERVIQDLAARIQSSANPSRALSSMLRFVEKSREPREIVEALLQRPRAMELLVALFAGSSFLTQVLLQRPAAFDSLSEPGRVSRPKSRDRLMVEALDAAGACDQWDDQLDRLRQYQRQELLRIGAADLLGLSDLETVTRQLTYLADALIQSCLTISAQRQANAPSGFAVIALGKLGGEELNYSSDIDLLFVTDPGGRSQDQLGVYLVDALSRITGEGFLYRVDMRLRPWGRIGPLVCTVRGYEDYFQHQAKLWERQALLKARAVAGDIDLGEAVLARVASRLFVADPETIRAGVRQMKRRIEARLRQTGRKWGEVKSGQGSIRDTEFVTQYLQLAYGRRHPQICRRNTLEGLAQLRAYGYLPERDYRILAEGYRFLRAAEHYLQIMHHHQTHSLPQDPSDLDYLARKLSFVDKEAGSSLRSRYEQHSRAIRELFERYVEHDEGQDLMPHVSPPQSDRIRHHLERMVPDYAASFSHREIGHHTELAARLTQSHLVEVEAKRVPSVETPDAWRVTVVGYDYPGELSVICGLLAAYGWSIQDGQVFTYEPSPGGPPTPAVRRRSRRPGRREGTLGDTRRKIVDVFTVVPARAGISSDDWYAYATELQDLLRTIGQGDLQSAQGQLAGRVATAIRSSAPPSTTLHPIDLSIDNSISARYTELTIDTLDTTGFLYEFSNALALAGNNIARVVVRSQGDRVHDVFYLTDSRGGKIESPDGQRKLRATTALVKHFSHLLPLSPNPKAALLHFRQFVGELFSRTGWPDELTALGRPEVLTAMARLLGVSDFLWDDFLRMQYANLWPIIRDIDALSERRSKEWLRAEIQGLLAQADGAADGAEVLNAFKDREMFRVDMRHIQGLAAHFGDFSAELSDVAEVVVGTALALCQERLVVEYGLPSLTGGEPSTLVVCALGKLGGRELGFASDIELLFVYAGDGETAGPRIISTARFYSELVLAFLGMIQAKREGIFEIDLRLRPYGSAGSMAVSLESFQRYYSPGSSAWPYERQAMVKLWPIAGDMILGEEILRLRDDFVYSGEPFDIRAMRAMRERQLRHLVTPGTLNAKFSPGGLVDVEYLVQGLQIEHGRSHERVRVPSTRVAMDRLTEAGMLSRTDHERLCQVYAFLRHLIDALRMVRGNARDLTVPVSGSADLKFLARRLGFDDDTQKLLNDLDRHFLWTQGLSERVLGPASDS